MRFFRTHAFAVLAAFLVSTIAASVWEEDDGVRPTIQPSFEDKGKTLVSRADSGKEDPNEKRRKMAVNRTSNSLSKIGRPPRWTLENVPSKASIFKTMFYWEDENLRLGGTHEQTSYGQPNDLDDHILKKIVATRDTEPILRAFEMALAERPEPERIDRARIMRNRVAAVRQSVRELGPDRARALGHIRTETARIKKDYVRARDRRQHHRNMVVKDETIQRNEAQLDTTGRRLRGLGLMEAALQPTAATAPSTG